MFKRLDEPYRDMSSLPEAGDVLLFKSKNNTASISVGLNSSRIHPIFYIFGTGAGPNLIGDYVLDQAWLDNICQSDMSEIQRDSDTKRIVFGAITLHHHMSESRTRLTSRVVDRLAVLVLLGSNFVDKYLKYVHPAERKIVPHPSPPGPNLMIHEAISGAEKNTSDIRQFIEEEPALLVTPISGKPKCITNARQVVLNVMCKTSVLVCTQLLGLVEVVSHENIAKMEAWMTAEGMMVVYRVRFFHITKTNLSKVNVHLRKHRKAGEVADALVVIFYVKNECF